MKPEHSLESLRASIGAEVTVRGTAENTKLRPQVLLEGGEAVPCILDTPHWPERYVGKVVQLTAIVAVQHQPSLPVATQDAQGGWTQGVQLAPSGQILSPTPDPAELLGPGSSTASPTSDRAGELVLRVSTHELLP